MSTRAKGASAPIDRRLTVGMTGEESATLATAARASGLSVARYLVLAGLAAKDRGGVARTVRYTDRLLSPRGYLGYRDVVFARVRPPRLGEPEAGGARRWASRKSQITSLPIGEVIVWRCEGDLFRVSTVTPAGLETVGWFEGAPAADEVVDRLLAERGVLVTG